MEWQVTALLIFGSFFLLLALGMPVAFAFVLVNIGAVVSLWGFHAGFVQLFISMWGKVHSYSYSPVILFILMGEVAFRSDLAPKMIDTLDKWLGRMPGRLGVLTVGGGAVFATMCGEGLAAAAMLGSVLTPEMERRGYSKAISVGAVLGGCQLSPMIPPSNVAVIVATLASVSVGATLIGIIGPGLMMAAVCAIYIVCRCWLQPSIAPAYDVIPTPLSERITLFLRYVLPLATIFIVVIGSIFLGLATASEAGALGTLVVFILTAVYKKFNWQMLKTSVIGSLKIIGMVLFILCSISAFSAILVFTGVTQGLIDTVLAMELSPFAFVVMIQILYLIIGLFMGVMSAVYITFPIFLPLIYAMGIDPLWFIVMTILNADAGGISPPYGSKLFVLKGIASPGTTMGDIYRAALPIFGLNVIVLITILFFPAIVVWLPSVAGLH